MLIILGPVLLQPLFLASLERSNVSVSTAGTLVVSPEPRVLHSARPQTPRNSLLSCAVV